MVHRGPRRSISDRIELRRLRRRMAKRAQESESRFHEVLHRVLGHHSARHRD